VGFTIDDVKQSAPAAARDDKDVAIPKIMHATCNWFFIARLPQRRHLHPTDLNACSGLYPKANEPLLRGANLLRNGAQIMQEAQ
jgi:hypothetical protein